MEHAQDVQWHESYYWRQLEGYHTTVKELKERLSIQSRLVQDGMMSPLNPQYLALQAVVRKIEPDVSLVKPWWKFW